MRRKNLLWMFFALTLIISILTIGISLGSPGTLLSVDPPLKVETKLPGQTFSINANITQVVNLTGYEFKLGYDTTVLTATNITVGPFFLQYKIWTEEINDILGYVHYAVSLPPKIPPLPGVSGSGVLATVDFTVDSYGESALDLYETKLTGYDGYTSYPIYPDKVNDGYFSNTGVCTPIAYFTFEPQKPVAGKNVTFNASASFDPDGTIVGYEWDFGDGNVISETDPTIMHIYALNGTYNAILTVTDDDSIIDTTTEDVTVELRDIAITNINCPEVIPTGESAVINITIMNNGTLREWFNVTAYYENATAKYPIWYNETANQKAFSLKGLALLPGENMNVIFNWTTTDIVGTRIYHISANACLVDYDGRFIPNESDTTNNAGSVDVIVKASHDIAVTNVKPSREAVIIGDSISIDVTVQNEGTSTETFNVTVYYDSSAIGTHTGVSLDADTNITVIFTWNTTGIAEDEYTISANATIIDGEDDTADNERIYDEKIRLSEEAVHDIAVVNVTADPTSVIVGASILIDTTVRNLGTEEETFNVTLYYDGNVIPPETVINLAPGADKKVTFSWDTLGVPVGSYIIKAEAPPVPEETETANNFFTRNVTLTVKVTDHITVVGGVPFRMVIESNSDVSDFTFNQTDKEISFNCTGELVTGFCNVTIPKDLLDAPPDQWIVLVDGESKTPFATYNDTHTFLYFTFDLSIRTIRIIGTTVATNPVASFNIFPTDSAIGELVTFNASASFDPDGVVVSYKWNFGDGNITIVADPVVTHIYSAAGTYTVTLTAKDDDGLSSEPAQKPITVLLSRARHDIVVMSVTALPTTVTAGKSVSINVTVANKGNFSETFNVTVYYNENLLGTQTDITLSAGDDTTLKFSWNTTNVLPGNYTISAKASVLPNETDTANNTYIDGTVEVKETPTTEPVILYVAAAVAIVIIIATIVVYFVRFRKS